MKNQGRLNHTSYGVVGNEKGVCRALGATGIMTLEDARKKFGVEAVNALQDKKMIKKLNTIADGKMISVIHLSEKGRSYTRKHLTYGSLYSWNRLQINHDIALNRIYLNLSPEEQRSWKNEGQIRKFSGGKIRGIDGSYINRKGESIAVEIITPNYPASKLREKIATMNEYFDGIEITSV